MERIIEYQADINNHDIKTDRILLSYDNVDKFIIDVNQIDADFESASIKALFICFSYNDEKKYAEILCHFDNDNKRIEFKIPDSIRGHVGLVKSSVYMETPTGDRLDIIGLSFKMKKSLIDDNATEIADFYFETFTEKIKDTIERIKSYEDVVEKSSEEASVVINNKIQEISHLGDGLSDIVQGKIQEVQNIDTDISSFIEDKKYTINSLNDNFVQFIEGKTAEAEEVSKIIATYKDSLDDTVLEKIQLINSNIENIQSEIKTKSDELENVVSTAKSDILASKDSFNTFLSNEKSSIQVGIDDIYKYKDSQIAKIGSATNDNVGMLNSYANTKKIELDNVVNNLNSYSATKESVIDGKVDDFSVYVNNNMNDIVEKKQEMESIIPEMQNVLNTMQSSIDSLKSDVNEIPDYKKVLQEITTIKGYLMGDTIKDVYGVEVDMVNKTVTRISGSIGKSGGKDFDNIRAYQRRRCNLTDDGKVLAYFGEDGFVENGFTDREFVKNGVTYPIGTPVQVMVEQPKFYYKVVPLVLEPIANDKGYHMRKGRYCISDYPKEGFKIHPAFVRNGVEREKIYLSAYEGSIYDKSASAYLLNDEQVADFSADMLSSIANAKPCSGLTQNLTRANARLLAHNRGNGWEQLTIQTVSLTQLLFLIEYAKFNMQDVLGMGVTTKKDDAKTNVAEITGATTNLGNKSGNRNTLNGYQSVTYRGEENIYGNIWKFIDGINVMANGIHATYVADHDFNDKQSTGSYTDVGFTLAKTNGFVSAFGYSEDCDWTFMATETKGNSSVPVGDYFWQNYTATDDGGWRGVRAGAGWDGDTGAGGFRWNVGNPSVGRGRDLSGRLVFIGG